MNNNEKQWNALKEHFDNRGADGAAVVAAFKEVYSMYTDMIPAWLAGLYDHKTGGFYYSNSARDNEPFLPDIESTNQALNLLMNSGMISSFEQLPKAMRDKMAEFVCSRLDPDDGYIYHPQWGKDIVDSRRGRDLNWTVGILKQFGVEPKCKTAYQRLEEANAVKSDEGKEAIAIFNEKGEEMK